MSQYIKKLFFYELTTFYKLTLFHDTRTIDFVYSTGNPIRHLSLTLAMIQFFLK